MLDARPDFISHSLLLPPAWLRGAPVIESRAFYKGEKGVK